MALGAGVTLQRAPLRNKADGTLTRLTARSQKVGVNFLVLDSKLTEMELFEVCEAETLVVKVT